MYADASVGRLHAACGKRSTGRGLLTIVTSDHGEAFGEHGRTGHNRTVFDEEVRVPLILRWPDRIVPGQRIREPVHLVDVLPTILAAAGTEHGAAGLAGVDLLPAVIAGSGLDPERPLLLQRPQLKRRSLYRSHKRPPLCGVRRGKWKLVESRGGRRGALFDLQADPGETRDLAGVERERTAHLAAEIAAWRTVEAARAPAPPHETLSDDARQKLRALGYVD